MNRFNKQVGMAAVLGLGMVFAGVAAATTVTMGFDELAIGNAAVTNGQFVADFYNGGCGQAFTGPVGPAGPVTCGGPDYGVVWTGAAVARGGTPAGTNMPSPPNILVRASPGNLTGPVPVMNVANGFESGFSFWYSASNRSGNVSIYSGLDGTGDLLASTGVLPTNPTACLPHTGLFACWSFIDSLVFDGIAHSVVFSGNANTVAWDNISFDLRPAPPVGVPEPAALGTFGLGALLIGLFAGLRRRYG